MTSLALWWRGLSLREQRLIALAATLAAALFIWLGVMRPLGSALGDARRRHDRGVLALADARAQAATIASLERALPAASAEPISQTVAAAAAQAGFVPTRLTPEGDGTVTLALDAARPAALFPWIETLQTRHGLTVVALATRANPDRSLTVQLTLSARRP